MDILKQLLKNNNNNNDLNIVSTSKPNDCIISETGTAKMCNSDQSSLTIECPSTELPKFYEECAKNPDMDVSEKMKFEIIRFSTFSALKDCPIAFMKLSKAGFYYDNASKAIICFKCGYVYENIQSNDDPMEIHFKNSPNCDFVQKHYDASRLASSDARAESFSNAEGACGGQSDIHQLNSYQRRAQERENVSQNENPTRTPTNEEMQSYETENQSVISENNYQNNTSTSNHASTPMPQISSQPVSDHVPSGSRPKKAKEVFKDLGICVEKPKYPKYSILATRIASFKNWPISDIVSPNDLSKAGFYYNGTNETVCCFFCGGKLAEWKRGDDPWIEHAHWFPNCQFVQQCKGNSSFKNKQDQKEELTQPEDPFETAAFKSVMELGYTKAQIKTVYDNIQNKVNLSAKELLELLMDKEDKESEKHKQARRKCSKKEHVKDKGGDEKEEKIQQEKQPKKQEESGKSNKQEVKALVSEYQGLKEQTRCKICLEEDATVVFLPCGHMCTCVNCSPAMRKCPICRTFVKGTVKAILS